MATVRVTAEKMKNDAGPRWRTNSAASATEIGEDAHAAQHQQAGQAA